MPLHAEATQSPEELPGLPKQYRPDVWTPEMTQLLMSYTAWLTEEHFGKVRDEIRDEIRDLAKTIHEVKTASNQTLAEERKPAAAPAVAVRHHR